MSIVNIANLKAPHIELHTEAPQLHTLHKLHTLRTLNC